MTPKLTAEMQSALSQSHGKPIDVVDDQGRPFVVVAKDAFAHLDSLRTTAEKDSIDRIRKLVQEGIASGPGIPMAEALNSLRTFVHELEQRRE